MEKPDDKKNLRTYRVVFSVLAICFGYLGIEAIITGIHYGYRFSGKSYGTAARLFGVFDCGTAIMFTFIASRYPWKRN